jgi:hypothetical protein
MSTTDDSPTRRKPQRRHRPHQPVLGYLRLDLPRCIACQSTKLRAFRSMTERDATGDVCGVMRWTACQKCGRRFYLIFE